MFASLLVAMVLRSRRKARDWLLHMQHSRMLLRRTDAESGLQLL